MSFGQIGETYLPVRVLARARGVAAAARRGLTCRHVLVAGSAIFLLANVLMAPGLAPAAALLVLLGCIGSLCIVVKATAGTPTGPTGLLAARIEPRTFALCWVAALALCVLGGEGHFFFANYDWLNRDAADAGSVPHVWLVTWDGFWSLYAIFIAVQVPQIAVVALYWRRLDDGLRLLSILAIGMLLAIPTYGLGASNDFSMRASILPLALVGFVFASIVVQLRWRDGIERVAIVAVLLALGSFTPVLEIQRSLMVNAFAISDCNVLTAWRQLEPDKWPANYFARADRVPAGLLARGPAEAPVRIEDRQCWLDHPYRARDLPTA